MSNSYVSGEARKIKNKKKDAVTNVVDGVKDHKNQKKEIIGDIVDGKYTSKFSLRLLLRAIVYTEVESYIFIHSFSWVLRFLITCTSCTIRIGPFSLRDLRNETTSVKPPGRNQCWQGRLFIPG